MAYPMRANRSYDLSSAHRARGLSADDRYARKKASRWVQVVSSADKRAAYDLFSGGAITAEDFQARCDAAEDRKARLLDAARDGEFPAPKGFDLTCNTTPEHYAAAVAQAEAWEAAQAQGKAN